MQERMITELPEPSCRHGYLKSECFTCNHFADIKVNSRGEKVVRMGRDAILNDDAENVNDSTVMRNESQ